MSFKFFCRRQIEKMQVIKLLQNNCERSDEDQPEESSIQQEQCDKKICYWFWDEIDLKGNQAWWEMMRVDWESLRCKSDRLTEDKKDDNERILELQMWWNLPMWWKLTNRLHAGTRPADSNSDGRATCDGISSAKAERCHQTRNC